MHFGEQLPTGFDVVVHQRHHHDVERVVGEESRRLFQVVAAQRHRRVVPDPLARVIEQRPTSLDPDDLARSPRAQLGDVVPCAAAHVEDPQPRDVACQGEPSRPVGVGVVRAVGRTVGTSSPIACSRNAVGRARPIPRLRAASATPISYSCTCE
ncbi:hypothetical protein LNK82_01570 [Saccharothrix sp. NEAU-S10]|nr:hypothetical protein [Saccharothrix luteola]MCC8242981.1 hypothetical protein [Saccharothrix luteola]